MLDLVSVAVNLCEVQENLESAHGASKKLHVVGQPSCTQQQSHQATIVIIYHAEVNTKLRLLGSCKLLVVDQALDLVSRTPTLVDVALLAVVDSR